jgi:hypothetical protein
MGYLRSTSTVAYAASKIPRGVYVTVSGGVRLLAAGRPAAAPRGSALAHGLRETRPPTSGERH